MYDANRYYHSLPQLDIVNKTGQHLTLFTQRNARDYSMYNSGGRC